MSSTPAAAPARAIAPADLAYIAVFAALIAALSIVPPIPVGGFGVPITLQTLGVASQGHTCGTASKAGVGVDQAPYQLLAHRQHMPVGIGFGNEGMRHRAYILNSLLADLRQTAWPDRSPLSEIILSYMNFEFAAEGQGLFETLHFSKHASKTDISIFVSDTGANIGIALEYYADLFSEADVLRMARDYVRMLELMTSAPADAPLRFTPADLPCAAGGAASLETCEALAPAALRQGVELLQSLLRRAVIEQPPRRPQAQAFTRFDGGISPCVLGFFLRGLHGLVTFRDILHGMTALRHHEVRQRAQLRAIG